MKLLVHGFGSAWFDNAMIGFSRGTSNGSVAEVEWAAIRAMSGGMIVRNAMVCMICNGMTVEPKMADKCPMRIQRADICNKIGSEGVHN